MEGYENLDEYEDDGFIVDEEEQVPGDGFIDDDEEQVSEEDEVEEEKVQEEVKKPTKDEMDYLKVRQELKEAMRRKMKKGNDSVTGNSQEREKRNYGSFFGPSQPAIARRVIEESKSLLENMHLAAKVSKPHHSLQSQKNPAVAKATPKPGAGEQPVTVVSMEKQKARILKEARDYKFLFSEDAELPAPAKVLPPKTSSVPNSDARSAQVTPKIPKSVSNTSRPVLNGREQRPPVAGGNRMQSKQGQRKPIPDGRLDSTSVKHREQLGSSTGNGSSRPQEAKGLPTKTSVKPSTLTKKTSVPDTHTKDRNASLAVEKRPPSDVRKTMLPRPHPSMSGQQKPLLKSQPSSSNMQRAPSKSHPHEQGKDVQEPDRSRLMPKQPVSCPTAPKVKTPKKLPSRPPAPKNRQRKRSMSPEPFDYRQEIRNLTGYDPSKYGNDRDDRSMEASFKEIEREEKRSARIANKEDERERLLQEEEEKKKEAEARMRKKRKLSSQQ
ncbi:hypothetical protein C5167_043696 [Papaver somniferum]|uniref:SPT2 chromatin protein n=1 Tax=Papaver somniferum TaxID=3469 RepID=A0A4Y7L7E0_PAPSO|nr:protein SPT2 homolog [Papaver somniferum]RZC81106.1 hypothetical protein C5167_043696 [Papaver somniferum]